MRQNTQPRDIYHSMVDYQSMVYKLMRTIPCRKMADIFNAMLYTRSFQVIMGDKASTKMKLNYGFSQGSVLVPLLFSLYIAGMPRSTSKKFGYAPDWALVTSHRELEITEQILANDLATKSTLKAPQSQYAPAIFARHWLPTLSHIAPPQIR